jgi:hypothetical protein
MNTHVNTVRKFLKTAEAAGINTLRQLSVFMSCAQTTLTSSQLKSEYAHISSHVVDVQRRLLNTVSKSGRKVGIGLLQWGDLRDTGGVKREREIKLTSKGRALHVALLDIIAGSGARPYDQMIALMAIVANDHELETCNQLAVILSVYDRNNQTLDCIFDIPLDDVAQYHKMTSRMPGFMAGEKKTIWVDKLDPETGETMYNEKGEPIKEKRKIQRPGLRVLEWGERPHPSLGYHHRIRNLRMTDKGVALVEDVIIGHFSQFNKAA